jgi:hypothetical protein
VLIFSHMNIKFTRARWWPLAGLVLAMVAYGGYWYGVGGGELATGTGVPDKLVVTRQWGTNDHSPTFTGFVKTILNPEVVGELFRDIYASSSAIPGGIYQCPIQVSDDYVLDFYKDGQFVLHVDYTPTGCRFIKLGTGTKRWAGVGNFNTHLQQALGLSNVKY